MTRWMRAVLTVVGLCAALPGARAGERADALLPAIRDWLLLLNNPLEPATVETIALSSHDMAVVDFIASIKGSEGVAMADIVAELKQRPAHSHPGPRRLVIAYLNIGQAEDYRTYWQAGWRPGSPTWIIGDDPDGWAGNFPVAFWTPAWKELIAGPGGYVDQIVAAGFDGVYLDWVGGYEFDPVVARAHRDGVDPAAEMIRWVGEVSARGESLSPGFVVIAQNAPDLWTRREFLGAIDAVVHESTWFTGTEDETMEGDCPTPRDEAEAAGSPEYLARLPPACARERETDATSAFHYVAEQYLLPYLVGARDAGKTVLTVDYAIEPANIAWIAERSRSYGFKPFVGARPLKFYVVPLP